MSEEIIIKSRIVCKHDTEANWLNKADFIPNKSEVIVYDIDETHDYERMKLGDGVTPVNDLPFHVSEVELKEVERKILQVDPIKPEFACTWFKPIVLETPTVAVEGDVLTISTTDERVEAFDIYANENLVATIEV
jgi:hypothetical protein